ncbi:MAG: acetoacetyl-CoA reductase [Hyphomicrobiaceae bacterium]|nr:acetoacetyl-CoA reductase [Hyphomicrobiaceae bacterium]
MPRHTAIVTGGTRGIGRGIAEVLAAENYTVIAGYGGNDQAAAEFTKETGIPTRKWDVADFQACQNAVASIEADFGPVTVLINNAGITRDATIKKLSYENWMAVIQTNLTSVFNMTKAVWDGMVAENFGRIVNISSINGQAGQYGQVNYCAAKAGVIGMTKALALEGARYNITANTVAPGYVATDMVAAVPERVLEKIVSTVPVGRLGDPAEIARAVYFLVRDDSNFVTGSTISINGGQHMY